MKKRQHFALLASLFLVSLSAFALPIVQENRGVNITVGSMGGALDGAALRAARRVVGFAVASGVVDNFVVYSPKMGGTIPREGGMSACAEAGFNADQQKFNGFINELRAIKPKSGNTYTVERVANCTNAKIVFCTLDVKSCPDGSYVSRIAPSCAFAACPAPLK